ncbi:hypothetical protein [Virgibacillus sp. YIM 98842]|uniref:hypothetical protein n=1 Tax=Virgibacillus sp. YIM 98842 TaxID=2663533 RepID=UPI0013DA9870|nr:hypothetical protein [Virgibacillus sp. YIM 98842]
MKMDEEEVLEEISGYLHGYLKSGQIRINSFLSKINVNIANLEQLLILRFLLRTETKDFVRNLPVLLKRFKTTTNMKTETYMGEVRGQIDWDHTIKERLVRNYKDKTIFSTNEHVRSYNIPENQILKELLGVFYSCLFKNDYIAGFGKTSWFSEWQKLKQNILHAYKRNIYIQRVDELRVPDRVVQQKVNHRNKLYRQAAALLLAYRRLVDGHYSEEDIRLLLRETFIAPDNKDVLMELYWVIQLIKQNTMESQLYLMDGTKNKSLVASWNKKSYVYRLYHDSVGSDKVAFRITGSEIKESNNPYLKQKYQSVQTANKITERLFGKKKSDDIWRGRPDFFLEIVDGRTSELVKIVIGEVKNTTRKEYAIKGLEELLDYLHFVKDSKGEYMLHGEIEVRGILCVGGMEMKGDAEMNIVQVVKLGDLLDLKIEVAEQSS